MRGNYIGFAALTIAALAASSPATAAITGETATASNTAFSGAGDANQVVNNNGITMVANPSLAVDGDFEHDDDADGVWQTGSGGNAGAAIGTTLTIDLGANYDLWCRR